MGERIQYAINDADFKVSDTRKYWDKFVDQLLTNKDERIQKLLEHEKEFSFLYLMKEELNPYLFLKNGKITAHWLIIDDENKTAGEIKITHGQKLHCFNKQEKMYYQMFDFPSPWVENGFKTFPLEILKGIINDFFDYLDLYVPKKK